MPRAAGLPAVRALSTVSSLSSSSPAPAATAEAADAVSPLQPSASSSSSSSSSFSSPSSSTLLPLASPFPFAAAPDIIRAHQKDAYFAGTLANDLADLVLRLAGGRTAHAWAAETRTAAELAYWGLTAGLGHRTLGEEYCDLMAVTPKHGDSSGSSSSTLVTPSPLKQIVYVVMSVLGPYLAGRSLPSMRRALRARLETRVAQLQDVAASDASQGSKNKSTRFRVRVLLPLYRYLLAHLDGLTSGTRVRAVTLALFYFYGAYYTLTTRLLGLRYVFLRRRPSAGPPGAPGNDPVGYEVLGALLVLQMGVQGYLHVRDTLTGSSSSATSSCPAPPPSRLVPVQASLDHEHTYTPNNELLLGSTDAPLVSSAASGTLAAMTHTPETPRDPDTGGPGYRFSLDTAQTMRWLGSRVQRQCTLCLEVLKDPAATPCGHVFCWRCIGDWVREKPECPLCRRAAQPQHILPLQAL
ncbi:peroxisome bioproteinsis factor 10 [Sporothrix epigloea]|uniref:RING-type E3 ubiquitin transferase n=1 Tax=Sporothrix epigloea TaxID=1892477 RepID=A0ABP0DHD9_9PEZI